MSGVSLFLISSFSALMPSVLRRETCVSKINLNTFVWVQVYSFISNLQSVTMIRIRIFKAAYEFKHKWYLTDCFNNEDAVEMKIRIDNEICRCNSAIYTCNINLRNTKSLSLSLSLSLVVLLLLYLYIHFCTYDIWYDSRC